MHNEKFWKWYDEYADPKLETRKETFRKIFEHLDKFDRPVIIIETGCVESDENWDGNGSSTILYTRYVDDRNDGSKVFSVDILPERVEIARKIAGGPNTTIVRDDSVAALEKWAEEGIKLDLLYLDASHLYWDNPLPSAIHHHRELMAAMPMISTESMVVVDDTPARVETDIPRIDLIGKGKLVAEHMMLCGADLKFCVWQTGWTNVVPLPVNRGDQEIDVLVYRARKKVEENNAVAAEQIYRLVLGLCTPPRTGLMRVAYGEACAFYARAFLNRRKISSAAEWFKEALLVDPLGTDYRLDMILLCLIPLGNLRVALQEAKIAVQVSPEYGRAWKMLGGVHHEMDNAQGCLDAYEKRLTIEPDDPDAILDRALIALDMADYDKVREMCGKVMAIEGNDRIPDAIHCLAMVAYREHRQEEAIALYQEAIDKGCRDSHLAYWNMSLSLSSIGRYKEGWIADAHRSDTRVNPALYLPMRRFHLPLWTGQPPIKEDGTAALIHVHGEAGAGDNLVIARYLSILTSKGYRVRYECPDDMVGLMRDSFPDVEVVGRAADYPGALGISPFDYHCPIGRLPAVLGTDIDTVPWGGPYLFADDDLTAEYRDKMDLKRPDRNISVGFCWSSGIREGVWIRKYGLRKSMHYDELASIVDAVWLDLIGLPVSLQVGPERSQHDGRIADILPDRPTWSDTAALVQNLDLIITVDTAVAHLAGAMGKQVWVLCPKDAASWHFMCWRPGASWNERSPWYPTARVFRQHQFEPCFWDDVVEDVKKALLGYRDFGVGYRSAEAAAE